VRSSTYKRIAVALLVLSVGAFALPNVSRTGKVKICREACALPAPVSGGPLQVMVLNVRHGFPRFEHLRARMDYIAAEIDRRGADLVLLQEVPWTLGLGDGVEYLSRATGLNHVSVRDNGNRWLLQFDTSLAILSRHPLLAPESLELRPRAGFFEHRLALRAIAATPRGSVQVVVTHLTHGDPDVNRRQVDSLTDWVGSRSQGLTLVGGDFNAVPDSPQIRFLASRWLDTFAFANRTDGGFTCCVEPDTEALLEPLTERIDYLFVVPEPRTRAAVKRSDRVLTRPFRWRGGWLWASDHAGLLAEIDWQPRRAA
jgi:endonuclease/exonuclease/phosphatase family metal-dependent hydrolase